MQKIAIFGGTFNPIHWGHLLIAETALSQFSLDRVLWVPSYHPPHKSPALLAFEHRLEMVRRAIADHNNFSVSDIEATFPGPSYAIVTLQALQTLHPNTDWYWIIGFDAFKTLPKWRDSQEVATRCIWLVAPREKDESRSMKDELPVPPSFILHPSSFRYHLLEMPQVGISSSLVRQYCQQGRSIRYLLPEAVRAYILSECLYQGTA